MSGASVFHILFGSCIALLFVLNKPVSGDFKYERTIAFTVERTADMSDSTTSRDIGAFNKNSQKIYLNIGEALDVVTGRFKVPLEGVYYFYYSFSSETMDEETRVELFKLEAGKDLKSATLQVFQSITPALVSPLDSASASVMVELKRDDEVFLRLAPGLLDADADRPLLFTGYLVYREGQQALGY
ncbi:18kDa egg cortical vesicle protein precursor [Strongylocentrotus purpuratus]|uniref:CVp18 n=1 Tax=Strongylocentrotus purpuratus TaxID=7668 RepID=Q9GQV4_STRPU|nr:18kDa egg cortical vesicle protein precursor [Strongylocentrotus purpuratus]AAG41768.1 CVp18 [Strongylocentrotus purpuratus]